MRAGRFSGELNKAAIQWTRKSSPSAILKTGDLITFLQETERLSFSEAVERLAARN